MDVIKSGTISYMIICENSGCSNCTNTTPPPCTYCDKGCVHVPVCVPANVDTCVGVKF
ncbi:hypothetical protein [Vallitalea guaymasensis]|uniref:Uncharacterized protein n=1 Tax=Vallitalea guaymasensis TaxID=1185412 RepID=A0A8J8MAN9_9FIRM|nr:hypothetical protein [Vallitalea guaymasensis]QUH29220.1 hypothetical protein HYG85_09895 [Vallitalea guaymasensis]